MVSVDPEVLAGKPVIRGTRLAVEFILNLVAAGESEADIVANYLAVSAARRSGLSGVYRLPRA
jgi:uncharacterized protein (DUF433 family)